MKNLVWFFSAIVFILFSATPAIGQKKILHLKMDEEFTGYISDKSGKGNDAQIIDLNFAPDRFGNECRALEFDGDGFLTVPHDPSLNLNSGYTLSVWVKIPPKTGRLQWLTLICKGEQSVEHKFSPAFRVQFTSETASVNTASTKTIGNIRLAFPTNKWFHIAVTYDNKNLTIYQDGFEKAVYRANDLVYDNNEPLNIGRDIPGATEFFRGTMDDLILWNKVLSHKQIIAQYKNKDDKKLGSACPDTPPISSNTTTNNDKDKETNSNITSNSNSNSNSNTNSGSRPPVNLPAWDKMKERESADKEEEIVMEDETVDQDQEVAPPPLSSVPPPPPTPPVVNEEEELQDLADRLEEDMEEKEEEIIAQEEVEKEEEENVQETTRLNDSPQSMYSFDDVAENNLVLLLDISGSMKYPDKLPLLKETFLELIPHMRNEDIISIVVFSGGAKVVLDGVSAKKPDEIKEAIEVLASAGNTKAHEGLIKAFSVAKRNFKKNGNNRIILATDGNFQLLDLYPVASQIKRKEIALSAFSFGEKGPLVTEKFDKLTRLGGGNHTNITQENIEAALLKEVKAIRK